MLRARRSPLAVIDGNTSGQVVKLALGHLNTWRFLHFPLVLTSYIASVIIKSFALEHSNQHRLTSPAMDTSIALDKYEPSIINTREM